MPIVVRRYSSLTCSIRAACASPRLKARSVGRPRTTSRKWVERSDIASQRSRARAPVVRPISQKKTGTSGSVSSIESGRDEVEGGDQDQYGNGNDGGEDELGEVATEQPLERLHAGDCCGRNLGALGAVERGRVPLQPGGDEVEPELRDDTRGRVGADRLEAPGRGGTRDDHGHEESQRRCDVREGGAVEAACDHAREQHGLGENEKGGNDSENRVGSESDARGARATKETRVESSHTSESTNATIGTVGRSVAWLKPVDGASGAATGRLASARRRSVPTRRHAHASSAESTRFGPSSSAGLRTGPPFPTRARKT